MQQRLEFGRLVEIAQFDPQQGVGEETCTRRDMQSQCLVLGRIEQDCANPEATEEHDREGGENAADATAVKRAEVQAAVFDPLGKYRCDQEARNHKKYVDADEAAMHGFGEIVIGDHAADGDSTKSINVWAIAPRCCYGSVS